MREFRLFRLAVVAGFWATLSAVFWPLEWRAVKAFQEWSDLRVGSRHW
jgi:hypothetical protein